MVDCSKFDGTFFTHAAPNDFLGAKDSHASTNESLLTNRTLEINLGAKVSAAGIEH
jgi:hypothetical protein